MSFDFKDNEIPVNQNPNQYQDSGSESAFIGSWSSTSSSSFLTPSFGSELDSYDADLDDSGGDEFIAELTRRMADYMLDENEDDDVLIENQSTKQFQEPTRRSYADTVKKSIARVQPEQSVTRNELSQPPIQMYKVENQPRVGGRVRKGKMSESTQHVCSNRSGYSYRGGGKEFANGGGKGFHQRGGSGMRAIFLGSGSRNVMSGTGVFLPRSSTDAADHSRKKSGCSTVLVPTRVLQALEQHFNNIESLSQTNNVATQTHHVNKEKMQTEESVSVDHQDSKLPQDWIY
ncbi:uncharacterized protein LOC143619800 [Bidens hawaiensis]|uniref:uncharacterized protein LOC143619800 n=1 Tax=Bidens hawaiensis TaxID=980011 RepID=UPI00404A6074